MYCVQVCQDGVCRGSICTKHGLEQCFLSSKDSRGFSVRQQVEGKFLRSSR